jgi:hypothetical protein
MRSPVIAAFFFLSAAPLAAQELRQAVAPPPSAIEVAADGRVVMSSDICATLGGGPPAVPSAAYQAGIDAQGQSVAPADLPSSTPPIQADNFPIEIKRNLAGKFNVPAAGAYQANAVLGYVTLRDNRAYFNGQPMGDDQRAALLEACSGAKPGRSVTPPK